MDRFGPFADVDGTRPPYACTHTLSTDVEPAMPGEFHRSMASDAFMAVDAQGIPVNANAYLYMLLAGW